MVGTKQGVEYKVKLLKYLLTTKDSRLSPDISSFWEHVAQNFPDKPKQNGDELEEFCDREVQIWSEECNNPRKKRRLGHEEGSEYDKLMDRWVDVWDSLLLDHWQWVVSQDGPHSGRYDQVPSEFRDKVKERVEAKRKTAKPTPTPKSATQRKSQVDKFEYDGEKLKRVVDAAKTRAMEVGKPDLANAVNQIYEDALINTKLRVLLEAILTQTATASQNEQFQEFVRQAKRKLKEEMTTGIKKTSPQVRPGKAVPTVKSHVIPDSDTASGDGQSSVRAESDSAYASEPKDDRESKNSTSKRRRESVTSLEAAEEEDLAEAERAAKRRKHTESDIDGNYHPSSRKVDSSRKTGKQAVEQTSRDSSPLSDAPDTDVEAAKEAYVDEMVRRKSAEASRQAIEDEYGPVSPTVDDNHSWKSMASPTLHPTHSDGNNGEQQITSGADGAGARPSTALAKVPSPPPPDEQMTVEESSHAYKIITGAAAEAVNPALIRLEGKIDSLISNQKSQPGLLAQLPASGAVQVSAASGSSTTQDFTNIQNLLQSGDLDVKSPEMIMVISQLAQKATEASIHAAEAARHASMVARDASQLLGHLASQKRNERPNTRGRGKK